MKSYTLKVEIAPGNQELSQAEVAMAIKEAIIANPHLALSVFSVTKFVDRGRKAENGQTS